MTMQLFLNIPAELRDIPQWVNWRLKVVPGKPATKVPIGPQGFAASVTKKTDWSSFDAVSCEVPRHSGIGFVFTAADPYFGVDLDHILLDTDNGDTPYADHVRTILERFSVYGCYIERSPSRRGLHIIGRGALPDGKGHKWSIGPVQPGAGGLAEGEHRMAVEVYDRGRYFTMTGDVMAPGTTPIGEAQEALEWLLAGKPQGGWGGSHGQKDNAPQGWSEGKDGDWHTVDVVVDPKAEPPAALFAQLTRRRNFLATWEKTRTMPNDQSDSAYDMALASMATAAGWADQQICNLLVAFRRLHGLAVKRIDYYQRTIHTARSTPKAMVAAERLRLDATRLELRQRRMQLKESEAQERRDRRDAREAQKSGQRQAVQHLVAMAIGDGADGVCRAIQQLTGLAVTRYVQVGKMDASYRVYLQDGDTQTFSTPKRARSQDAWQDLAQTTTGVPFMTMAPADWQQFLVLLSIILEKEAQDETPQSAFLELLAVYTKTCYNTVTYDNLADGRPVFDQAEGVLYITVPDFHTWMGSQKIGSYRQIDIVNWLKVHSASRCVLSQRLEGASRLKVSRKYWQLPWPQG